MNGVGEWNYEMIIKQKMIAIGWAKIYIKKINLAGTDKLTPKWPTKKQNFKVN